MTSSRLIRSSAWLDGKSASAEVNERMIEWARGPLPAFLPHFLGTQRPQLVNWRDPRVGWGLVLSYNTALSSDKQAQALDAPEALQDLVGVRAGPVLRYDPAHLGRLYDGRCNRWLAVDELAYGLEPGRIPHYLLLYGSPRELPWQLQYELSRGYFVGRLDLDEDGLNNYVNALLTNWQDATIDTERGLVWAVEHGPDDITALMRIVIADELVTALRETALEVTYIAGSNPFPTHDALIAALQDTQPGMIITTSHGCTAPLTDMHQLGTTLGLLVDQHHQILNPERLLANWQPSGAIWYAHACCSAGNDSPSAYHGLFDPTSTIGLVLTALERLGTQTAPLPQRLLGAKRPLRAFIGHVEPTFDLSLVRPDNGQRSGSSIITAISDGLYMDAPKTIGMALQEYWFNHVGGFYGRFSDTRDTYDRLVAQEGMSDEVQLLGNDHARQRLRVLKELLWLRLTTYDRRNLVLLGDPTVFRPMPVVD